MDRCVTKKLYRNIGKMDAEGWMGGWYKDKWMYGWVDIVISDMQINKWDWGIDRIIEEEKDWSRKVWTDVWKET